MNCGFVVAQLTDRGQLNSLEARTVEELYLKGNPLCADYKDMKTYVRCCALLVFYISIFTTFVKDSFSV